jgi:hypothetical protein
MNTSTTTRGLRVAAVVAAATGSVLAGGGAARANEAAGHVSEAGITCYSNPHYPGNNQVVVQPPAMSGAAATKRVAYQAVLYRWDGTRFAVDRIGREVRGTASDAVRPVRWDDGEEASTWFSTPGSGSYAVRLRYTWYADRHSTGLTAAAWARGHDRGRTSSCLF